MSCKYIIQSYIYNKIIANIYTRTVLCVWTFAKTGYNIFSYKYSTDFLGCRTVKTGVVPKSGILKTAGGFEDEKKNLKV